MELVNYTEYRLVEHNKIITAASFEEAEISFLKWMIRHLVCDGSYAIESREVSMSNWDPVVEGREVASDHTKKLISRIRSERKSGSGQHQTAEVKS